MYNVDVWFIFLTMLSRSHLTCITWNVFYIQLLLEIKLNKLILGLKRFQENSEELLANLDMLGAWHIMGTVMLVNVGCQE